MNYEEAPESPRLSATTSGFVLAAAITVLFNTALALAKDAYAPLNDFMKSLTSHHWITHGLADLILFVGLGLIFTNSKVAENMPSNGLIAALAGAVALAALGLILWFAFV